MYRVRSTIQPQDIRTSEKFIMKIIKLYLLTFLNKINGEFLFYKETEMKFTCSTWSNLYNRYNKMQGWCDTPLTEPGIEGAEKAGEALRTSHSILLCLVT